MSQADRTTWWVGGVFLGALAVRAGYFLTLRHDLFFLFPLLDAEAYDGWARAIAGGELSPPGVFFLNPGYPYLLGGLYMLLGRSLGAAAWLNFVLGAATAALLVRMGWRLGFAWAGRLAGMAFALYGPAMFYEGQTLSLALMAFLNLLALAALLEWDARGREEARWLAVAGTAFGGSVLLRPHVLPAVAAALAWVAWRAPDRAARLRAVARLGLPVLYLVLPVIIRNSVVARELTGVSVNDGLAFYMGHWRGADGAYGPAPFQQGGGLEMEEDYRREASRRSGRDLTAAESSRFWFREGIREIVAVPVRWAWLEAKKAALFWNREEMAINLEFRFARERMGWLRAPWPGYGLVATAALAGLGMAWRAGPGFRLLAGYVVAYLAATLMVFAAGEYRYPAVPVLCFLGAAAGCALWEELRSRRLRPATVGAWAAAAAFVHLPLAGMKPEIPLYNLGILFERAGRPAEAEAYYRKAVEANPGHAVSWNSVGLFAYNRQDYASAREAFERALAAAPRLTAPRVNLGNAYLQEGRLAEARRVYEEALGLDPWAGEAWSNLGVLRARKGDWTGAYEAFRRASTLRPSQLEALSNLGEASSRLGRWREAAEAYRRILARAPGDREAVEALRAVEAHLR